MYWPFYPLYDTLEVIHVSFTSATKRRGWRGVDHPNLRILVAIGTCLVILAICIFLEAWTEEPFFKEVVGLDRKGFVFLGTTQPFCFSRLACPVVDNQIMQVELLCDSKPWSFFSVAFMTCEALILQLLGGNFKKVFSRIADLHTWDGDPCPGAGKGLFFQIDSVDSQDSVDVMAVCWLRISGADVSLPTKSGASNHLGQSFVEPLHVFLVLLRSRVLPCFSYIFHENQKTACFRWKMNDSTTSGKLLISGRSLVTFSSRGGFIRSCFCELVLWASQELALKTSDLSSLSLFQSLSVPRVKWLRHCCLTRIWRSWR